MNILCRILRSLAVGKHISIMGHKKNKNHSKNKKEQPVEHKKHPNMQVDKPKPARRHRSSERKRPTVQTKKGRTSKKSGNQQTEKKKQEQTSKQANYFEKVMKPLEFFSMLVTSSWPKDWKICLFWLLLGMGLGCLCYLSFNYL